MVAINSCLRASACCVILAGYCLSPSLAQTGVRHMSGTLTSLDKNTNKAIIQVNYLFTVEEDAKINGKPASQALDDIKAGSKVSISYTKDAEGKRYISMMKIKEKQAASEKQKPKAQKATKKASVKKAKPEQKSTAASKKTTAEKTKKAKVSKEKGKPKKGESKKQKSVKKEEQEKPKADAKKKPEAKSEKKQKTEKKK